MPDELMALLRERGVPIASIDTRLDRNGDVTIKRVVARTHEREATFEFPYTCDVDEMANSIQLAFDPIRRAVLHEIPGAISLTWTWLNPPGASYDYGSEGVTLDPASIGQFRMPARTTAFTTGDGQHVETKKPVVGVPVRVAARPKEPRRRSSWERLESPEWLETLK